MEKNQEKMSLLDDSSNELIPELTEEVKKEQFRISKYGTVPVFYAARKSWLRKNKYETPSIIEQLKYAETIDQVQKILNTGKEYKYASQGTIKKWEQLAQRKVRELSV